MGANLDVQNTSGATVVLPGFEQSIEYFSPSQNAWVTVANVAYDNSGLRIPPTTSLAEPFFSAYIRNFSAPGVTYSFFPPVVGTSITPGATGAWGYFTSVLLPPEVASVVLDPQQASAMRAVIRFNPIGMSTVRDEGAVDLTALFATLSVPAVNDIVATADLDFGVAGTALTTTASGLLYPGASALFVGEIAVPAAQPRNQFFDDNGYIDYLTFLAGQQRLLQANATAGAASAGQSLFLPSAVPVINAELAGPRTSLLGRPCNMGWRCATTEPAWRDHSR